MILEYEGYEVATAPDGQDGARRTSTRARTDAVLLDIKMPGMDGLEILDRIVAREDAPPVLMISGHGDIATAVECDAARRRRTSSRSRSSASASSSRSATRSRATACAPRTSGCGSGVEEETVLVGESAPMRRLRAEVARAAPTTATVLIIGESGTGKELVAREIHSGSRVAGGPFIQVNCAAIPEELIESELFGHEKGSFTGAVRKQIGKFVEADGGTIFLDEVGDMSARAQAKVLRVLEAGEVEPVGAARVAAGERARHRGDQPGPDRVDPAGRFREDLYFRLNVVPLRTPPAARAAGGHPGARRALLAALLAARPPQAAPLRAERPRTCSTARSWPGNVRELRNLVERVLIMTDADPIEAQDLPPEARVSPAEISEPGPAARDALRVQGVRRARVPRREAARERLEHQPHRRGHPDAALEPLQEDRAPQDLAGEGRVGRSQSQISVRVLDRSELNLTAS